jgi:hypothetical protein
MLTTSRLLSTSLLFALMALGCSSSSSSTFSCGPDDSCTSGSQYCMKVESTATYSCVNLPAGCVAADACTTCLSMLENTSCAETTIGSVSDIEVDTN